jgi:hypothetical protein
MCFIPSRQATSWLPYSHQANSQVTPTHGSMRTPSIIRLFLPTHGTLRTSCIIRLFFTTHGTLRTLFLIRLFCPRAELWGESLYNFCFAHVRDVENTLYNLIVLPTRETLRTPSIIRLFLPTRGTLRTLCIIQLFLTKHGNLRTFSIIRSFCLRADIWEHPL